MRSELTTARAINQACVAYAVGGSGHPVYCTVAAWQHNVRVFRAKTVKGVLLIKDETGRWVVPEVVFTL